MSVRSVDLMPAEIRERVNAARLRYVRMATVVVSVTLVALATTHAVVQHRAAAEITEQTRAEAARVLEREARIDRLRQSIAQVREAQRRYELIATPVEMADLMATIVNAMPEGMSIDQLDLDAAPRRGRSARVVTTDADPLPTRRLRGVIVGFAAAESDVDDFVVRLGNTPPFERVRIDISRSRSFRGRPVREFNLSFEVDFNRRYEVTRVEEGGRP